MELIITFQPNKKSKILYFLFFPILNHENLFLCYDKKIYNSLE